MYTIEMTIAITKRSGFYNLYNLSQKETDSKLTSRLEIVFLLDSCASISVRNLPAHTMITQMSTVCDQDQHHRSRTLTIAHQSQVAIRHKNPLSCFS